MIQRHLMMKTYFLVVFLLFCFASAKTKPAKRELKCGTGKKKGLSFFVFLISNLQMLIVYSSFFKTINKDEIT